MTETKVVNRHKEPYELSIQRDSMFGNPYTHIKDRTTKAEFVVGTREESIEKYREYFYKKIQESKIFRRAVQNLRGRVLGCTCAPLACHGDIIKEYLDNNPNDD